MIFIVKNSARYTNFLSIASEKVGFPSYQIQILVWLLKKFF